LHRETKCRAGVFADLTTVLQRSTLWAIRAISVRHGQPPSCRRDRRRAAFVVIVAARRLEVIVAVRRLEVIVAARRLQDIVRVGRSVFVATARRR
jgi:hypothetical protein